MLFATLVIVVLYIIVYFSQQKENIMLTSAVNIQKENIMLTSAVNIQKENTIHTSAVNIQLKPIIPSDASDITVLCKDAELMRYYSLTGKPWTDERIALYISEAVANSRASGCERKITTESGDFVGLVGYANDAHGGISGTFIHIIILKEYHGHGVASHAISAILDIFWKTAAGNCNKSIFAKIHQNNTASIKLHKKMGFNAIHKSEFNIYQLKSPMLLKQPIQVNSKY